jgi:hypothetical protein
MNLISEKRLNDAAVIYSMAMYARGQMERLRAEHDEKVSLEYLTACMQNGNLHLLQYPCTAGVQQLDFSC